MLLGSLAFLITAASTVQAQDRQGRGGFFGAQGGGFGGGGAMLLGSPEVQKELGVSDEQKGLIEDMVADLREQFQPGRGGFNPQDFQNMSEEERRKFFEEGRKRMEETNKKTDEMIAMILDEKQSARFNELKLQTEGTGAFNRDEIAKKLNLTEQQREKMKKIQEEARPDPSQFANFRTMSAEERLEAFTKMREKGEKANADVLNVLTGEQKELWAKMQGKKFEFPQPAFGGFGGGRRPGGGGEQPGRPETKKKDNQ